MRLVAARAISAFAMVRLASARRFQLGITHNGICSKDGIHWTKTPLFRRRLLAVGPLLFTPSVSNMPRVVREQVEHGRLTLCSLVGRAEHDVMSSERPDFSERCELILVDEADRLTTPSLKELRDHYDREKVGLVLIGMPGLEKRLSRYPQLYSRIGFAHAFRPLSQEETLFVLRKHGHSWGQDWKDDDFTDQEALAAITRITAGNFRLIDRLMTQVVRIMRLNQLNTVTKEVVDAARECLVIGSM